MKSTSIVIWSTLDVGHHWAYKVKAAHYFSDEYKHAKVYITIDPSSSHANSKDLLPNKNCYVMEFNHYLPAKLRCLHGKLLEFFAFTYLLIKVRPNLVFFEYPDSIFFGPLLVKCLCPNSFTLSFWMRIQSHLNNLNLFNRLKESAKLFVIKSINFSCFGQTRG